MNRQSPDVRDVVAGLLDDRRLIAACSERDMGSLFRLLNARGVSTRRIAAAVDVSQGRVYDYMRGKTRVEKLTLFEQIADAFHIPGHMLGLARRGWEPAAAGPQPHSLMGPIEADADDLSVVDHFRNADRQTGGGRLYAAVVRHLSDKVAARLVDAGSGHHVFGAAAALTEMAAWMAHDSGQNDRAAKHFARALPLAQASGDVLLAANVAAGRSHLALQTGDAASSVGWAQAGLDLATQGARVPALTAKLHTMKARALAASAQHLAASRALDQARHAFHCSTEAHHPWLSPFDAAALASESALILRDLGRLSEALEHATEAVTLRSTGRARSLTLSRISQVDILIRHGELDAAVHAGHGLLNASPLLGSVRVLQQLDELRQLLEPHQGHRPIREYLRQFDESRRARMLLLADIIPPSSGGTRR
ncbi:helix-turn-helix transcriptional regulator [Streptomyces durbertensis]|uniref:Helix-turn-helix transcriptional regulator n=2 Tax=Streptomyces durbertensis TaxID=2448886 RepID=A0ABR6EI49_9ACTN|nr:helix-turn-helix transcriptional regulator [Streptomyces durbertensis]